MLLDDQSFPMSLERLELWVTDEQWSIAPGAPEPMVKATNRQVIEHIVKQMKALLADNPSEQVDEVIFPGGTAPEADTHLA